MLPNPEFVGGDDLALDAPAPALGLSEGVDGINGDLDAGDCPPGVPSGLGNMLFFPPLKSDANEKPPPLPVFAAGFTAGFAIGAAGFGVEGAEVAAGDGDAAESDVGELALDAGAAFGASPLVKNFGVGSLNAMNFSDPEYF